MAVYKPNKKKPDTEVSGFLANGGDEGTRTLDLRLDRPAF